MPLRLKNLNISKTQAYNYGTLSERPRNGNNSKLITGLGGEVLCVNAIGKTLCVREKEIAFLFKVPCQKHI